MPDLGSNSNLRLAQQACYTVCPNYFSLALAIAKSRDSPEATKKVHSYKWRAPFPPLPQSILHQPFKRSHYLLSHPPRWPHHPLLSSDGITHPGDTVTQLEPTPSLRLSPAFCYPATELKKRPHPTPHGISLTDGPYSSLLVGQ